MRQISRYAFAATLVFASAAATSQEINKGDLSDPRTSFDQVPVSPGDVPVGQSGSQGKVRISNAAGNAAGNAPPNAVDAVNGGRNGAAAGREVSQQQTVLGAAAPRPVVMSEFQKFLFENTGKNLPIFGSEFFANTPSTFAPILNSPVPADYLLGPGDELLIRAWGSIDIDFRATIDRNGTVTIPTVGAVVLGGVKAGEAEDVVRGAIGRLYKGVTLSVNFGQLRAITVYVVGQASRPGTYTVSSLSTLVTALFASGGPNANGSMRRVQVKRAGKVVAELDLYAFIAKGDKSADIKLQDGDAIYIPAAGGYVALTGKVNSPAIYELRTAKDTVESVLDFAGGLPIVADPRRAFLERVDPTKSQPRSVEQFALSGEGLKKPLKNGDVLNITSITPDFSNAVVLRGNVDQPVRAPFKSGMRISDLIPNRDFLMSRASVQRQNSTLEQSDTANVANIASRIGSLVEEINWDYAVVERVNRNDLTVSLIPFKLGKVFEDPSSVENVQLQPGDTVTIFSQQDVLVPLDKRRVFVRVEGEVNVPGVYQMTPGENLQALLARAGGTTPNAYLFGTEFYREQVRKDQERNLDKVASRLESQLRSEQTRNTANSHAANAVDAQLAEIQRQAELRNAQETIARFRQMKPTGRIAFGLPTEGISSASLPALKLENGDKLVVPSKPDFVHVFGAVNAESSAIWRQSTTVDKYLKGAGVTADADLENVFIIRADGSIVGADSGSWFSRGVGSVSAMPGDTIVVPEKLDKSTAWSRFTVGVREWTQILANFGLGAAAIKVLK